MLQGQTVFHYEKPELTASFLAYLFIYLFKNMNAFIKCATIYTYLANSLCPFGFRCMGMYFPDSQDPEISEYSRLLKRGFLILFLKCQKTGHIDFRRIVPINVKIKVINSLLSRKWNYWNTQTVTFDNQIFSDISLLQIYFISSISIKIFWNFEIVLHEILFFCIRLKIEVRMGRKHI